MFITVQNTLVQMLKKSTKWILTFKTQYTIEIMIVKLFVSLTKGYTDLVKCKGGRYSLPK